MPLHTYKCEKCGKFEVLHRFGDDVAKAICSCGLVCPKSWDVEDLPMVDPGIEEYYEEQLDQWISTRKGLRSAMHNVEVESDGLVRPEWQ